MNHDSTPPARDFSRREFIAATTVASAALLATPTLLAQSSGARKRYALVGTGSRARMYQDAVNKTYAEHCEMVGYCDNNAGRLKLAQDYARELTGKDVPGTRGLIPAVVLIVTVVGFVAATGPARRGLRVQPIDALKAQ